MEKKVKEQQKEKKDWSEENLSRMLLAIAVLGGSEATSFEDLEKNYKEDLQEAQSTLYRNPRLAKDVVESQDERLSEQRIQSEVAKIASDDGERWLKVVTVGDEKVCAACREWQGKVVSVNGAQGGPSVDDFIHSGGLHYNCRCSLQELTTEEIQRKQFAWHSAPASRNMVFN